MSASKKISILFLFLAWSNWGFCQPVFTASESNLSQTVAQIQQIYGNQITLSTTAIENFLLPFVQNTVPEVDCPSPNPQIEQVGGGSVSFSWLPTTSNTYGAYYLNLNNGSNASTTTFNNVISYNNLQGLYLFGFYNDCGTTGRSSSDLIIVEVDVIFQDGIPETCLCDTYVPTPLFGDADVYDAEEISYEWPEDLEPTKFRLRTKGADSYNSELFFDYKKEEDVLKIYVYPGCDDNAMSIKSDPYHIGAIEDYYLLTFSNHNLLINFPESPFVLHAMDLDICTSNERRFAPSSKSETVSANRFEVFPNPGLTHTQLQYELSEDVEVQIKVYDLLGREIYVALPKGIQTKGVHQLHLDIEDWPKGNYACQIVTASFRKTLILKKE